MAGFEVAGAPLGQMVREWRLGRFTPLYLAGIAAGAGIGLGLSLLSGTGSATTRRDWFEIPPPVVSAPVVSAPAAQAAPSEPEITIALPNLSVVGQAFAAAEATLLNPAPVVPAPVQAAPAAQPAAAPAPAAPPVQSVAQQPPAPAPAAPASRPNFYLPTPSSGPATDLEQRLLDGINAERAKAGLPAYVLDAGLTKIARMRSKQLIDQNYFAHTDPFGYSMYVELLKHFGYTYAWAGENLAMNNTPIERSPQRAIEGLMNSATHRANLLADDFFRVGIGEVTTPDGLHYYAMIFLG